MVRFHRLTIAGVLLVAAGSAAFWFLTEPQRLDNAIFASLEEGDVVNGEQVFWASGCASCHAAQGATAEDRLALAGGQRFATEFGDFVAPNISSHERDGIGAWSVADLANAMMRGVSPDGQHYYPAFPYASYVRMKPEDVADLHAFMKTLPAIEGKAAENAISFPFNLRRGLGLWKLLYLDPAPAVALEDPTPQIARGQYLAEGSGHCAECHTPRDLFGGLDKSRWMAGAKALEGDGAIANITGGEDGIGDWSEDDIANLLESGFTPDYDSVGGSMAAVVRNMAELPASDRKAIAAYLKAIPPHPQAR